MTGIADLQDSSYLRIILEGDSGAGKTGCLASLVAAGYKLNLLDLESKLDILVEYLTNPNSPYIPKLKKLGLDNREKLNTYVDAVTITEEMHMLPTGRTVPRQVKAWAEIAKTMNEWPQRGKPSEWGQDTFLVIDSLSAASDYAMWYVQSMNNRSGADFKGYDWMRDLGEAQRLIERFLMLICSENFHCHVILITHLSSIGERETGVIANPVDDKMQVDPNVVVRQFPAALGKALSPRIPRRFSNIILAEHEGPKRRLYTVPNGSAVVKASAPLRLKPYYDLTTGLAEIVQELRRGATPRIGE